MSYVIIICVGLTSGKRDDVYTKKNYGENSPQVVYHVSDFKFILCESWVVVFKSVGPVGKLRAANIHFFTNVGSCQSTFLVFYDHTSNVVKVWLIVYCFSCTVFLNEKCCLVIDT